MISLWILIICFSKIFQDTFYTRDTHLGTFMEKLITRQMEVEYTSLRLLGGGEAGTGFAILWDSKPLSLAHVNLKPSSILIA